MSKRALRKAFKQARKHLCIPAAAQAQALPRRWWLVSFRSRGQRVGGLDCACLRTRCCICHMALVSFAQILRPHSSTSARQQRQKKDKVQFKLEPSVSTYHPQLVPNSHEQTGYYSEGFQRSPKGWVHR